MPTVLVTGASTGIGEATALRLARRGFTVFAGVRKDHDGERLGNESGSIVPVRLDVTNPGQITEAAASIESNGAGLDGLVNNAGIGLIAPVENVPLDQLRRQLEVNVVGQIAVIQGMLPLLRKTRGRIVNIGSIGDRITIPFGGPLCASKHAILAVNDALRMELAPWGIGVSLVEPASIKTEAVSKLEADTERVLHDIGEAGRAKYGDRLRTMVAKFAADERAGSQPDVVARKVEHALTAAHPRARYLVGKNARKLSLLARWVPHKVLDSMRLRLFGLS